MSKEIMFAFYSSIQSKCVVAAVQPGSVANEVIVSVLIEIKGVAWVRRRKHSVM